MAKRYPKAKTVSPFVQLVTQYARIKSTYTNIKSAQMNKHSRSFEIVMDITPSENSNTYEVKISYEIGKKPQAILLSPALKEYDGKMPHHIYGFDKNGHAILCVYCPYKYKCWDGLSTFKYSDGLRYLTKVVNEPKVEEIKQDD